MSRFTPTDKLFRETILRERPHKCERCGKTGVVQISHILPKSTHPRLRYQRSNVLLLCVGCHIFWGHKNPLEFTEWVLSYKGSDLLSSLRILEKILPKVNLKDIQKELKDGLV